MKVRVYWDVWERWCVRCDVCGLVILGISHAEALTWAVGHADRWHGKPSPRTSPRLASVMAQHDAGPEYAMVRCIGCPATSRIEHAGGIPTSTLKLEFELRGGSILPTRCPEHRKDEREETA